MATFRFRYTVFTVHADLGDRALTVKTGIKTVHLPIDGLRGLHVLDRKGHEHLELLLSYTERPGGRLKRARVFADREEQPFEALVSALIERRPEIDLRGRPASDAFREMGAVEAEWIVLPGVMALACVAVAVLLGPMWIHGFDAAAPARVSVEDLAAGRLPDTRNLLVTDARPLDARATYAIRGADERLGTQTVWLPLVPPEWKPGADVAVVLELRGVQEGTGLQPADAAAIPAVLRDAWWEGLSNKRRAAFADAGTRLAPEVRLLEYRGNRRHDLYVVISIVGGLVLVTVAAFLYLRARRPRRS